MMTWVRTNAKWITHTIGALAVLLLPLLAGADLTDRHQWLNAGILAAGTVAIAVNSNLEAGAARYAKGIIAALTAALVALNTLSQWPPGRADWIQVALAVLTAVGVTAKREDAPQAVLAAGPGRMGDQAHIGAQVLAGAHRWPEPPDGGMIAP